MITIRVAEKKDIKTMYEIDKERFGEYGSSEEQILRKMKEFPGCAVIGFDNKRCIGFFIFEVLNMNDAPRDFSKFIMNRPIRGSWLHAVIFTPRDDYKDHALDSKLLLKAEKIAKDKGCIESIVPLSKDHPFIKNKVFEFWTKNGYKKSGETTWIINNKENIECWIYRKDLL